MFNPGPVPPVPAVAEGAGIWPLVISSATALIIAAIPYWLGHRKAGKPPEAPRPPAAPPSTPESTEPRAVVADLVTQKVSVLEGSPEWAIVHMVNTLDRRTSEIEERAEERDREWQERYDQLDRRWQKRYSELEKRNNELLQENANNAAEVKALRAETSNLRAEVHTLRGRLGGPAL